MAMDSPLGPFALSSAGLLQPGPEDPALRGSGMGISFRDQLDRITGGIKRRNKHLRNLQRRLEYTHAQIAELNLAIAPLQKRILLETNSIATLRTQAISLESSLKDEEVYERSIRWVDSSFPGLASNLDADLLVSARTLYRKLYDAWSDPHPDSLQCGTCSRPTLDTSIATPKDVSVGDQEPSIQIDQAPFVVTSMVERPINFKVAMRRLHVLRNHVNVLTSSLGERGAAQSSETVVGLKKRRPRPQKCHTQYGKIANALISNRLIQRDGGWEVLQDDSC